MLGVVQDVDEGVESAVQQDRGGAAAGHPGGPGHLPKQGSEVWLGGAWAELQTGMVDSDWSRVIM